MEIVDDMRLSLGTLMTVGTDDAVAGTGGLHLNAVEHGCEIMRDKVGHYNADDLWRLLAQTLSKGVGAVVQLFSQRLHLLLHLLTNLWTSVQGTTDSGNAHAQLLGNVFQ